MGSTVDKARVVFWLKCNGWVEEAASRRAEQLRMRLESGVARQLLPAQAAAAAAGPVRHLRTRAPGHPTPLRQRRARGTRECSRAGGAARGLYSFSLPVRPTGVYP